MQSTKFLRCFIGTNWLVHYGLQKTPKLSILRCHRYVFPPVQVVNLKCYHQLHYCSEKKSTCYAYNPIGILSRDFSVSHHITNKKKTEIEKEDVLIQEPEKLSLVKRYKKLLKEYWYVLIPVHIATSTVWFILFYYTAKSGVDVIPFLEMLNLPETVIRPFRNSSLGYLAVASAMYKLATPARYMVTLGATTVAIKQLTKRGLIKPVPSKDKFKTMIKDKFQAKRSSTKSHDS